MKGDFTRDTFDPAKHFSRVLMQQGRVTLDADFNEQAAILLHYMRTLALDLIGPYAAPSANAGFLLSYDKKLNDIIIGKGRYYVDGILVENDEDTPYSQQPNYPLAASDPLAAQFKDQNGSVFWAYLDVWERHITAIEDDDIREKALNGPDTCTRAQVIWQVRALPASKLQQPDIKPSGANVGSCSAPLGNLLSVSTATLGARIDPGVTAQDACVTAPNSKYRGVENQLYRVEVHDPGTLGTATFKWSRDNGSNASAWVGTSKNDITVGRGAGFTAGSWIELTDDTKDLSGLPGVMVRLSKVEGDTLSVDPGSVVNASDIAWSDSFLNPKIRRWDQTANSAIQLTAEGVVPVLELSPSSGAWIPLEDGLQIHFSQGGRYVTGDYWLIPARVATGALEWPPTTDAAGNPVMSDGAVLPKLLPPDGVEHHYAPLGFFSLSNSTLTLGSCRCTFDPASSCFRTASLPVGAHLVKPINYDAKLLSEESVEESLAAAQAKKHKK